MASSTFSSPYVVQVGWLVHYNMVSAKRSQGFTPLYPTAGLPADGQHWGPGLGQSDGLWVEGRVSTKVLGLSEKERPRGHCPSLSVSHTFFKVQMRTF